MSEISRIRNGIVRVQRGSRCFVYLQHGGGVGSFGCRLQGRRGVQRCYARWVRISSFGTRVEGYHLKDGHLLFPPFPSHTSRPAHTYLLSQPCPTVSDSLPNSVWTQADPCSLPCYTSTCLSLNFSIVHPILDDHYDDSTHQSLIHQRSLHDFHDTDSQHQPLGFPKQHIVQH